MSVRPVSYFEGECDGCGADFMENSEYGAMNDPQMVVEILDGQILDGPGMIAACCECVSNYRKVVSELEYDRFSDGEFWATWAFRGWLIAREVS